MTSAAIPTDLASARSIGEKAAERTLRRLDARKIKYPAVARYCLRPIWRVESSAVLCRRIGGAAQYRKASFLLDSVGEACFPGIRATARTTLSCPQARWPRPTSTAEGVATREADSLVSDGVIQTYLLDSYSARKLDLQSTGHASGVHNLCLDSTGKTFEECLAAMHRGLLVTELMGHGVNTVTGDYSRGAAGFWVENGKLEHASRK